MTPFGTKRIYALAGAVSALVLISAGCGGSTPVPSPAASTAPSPASTAMSSAPSAVPTADFSPAPSTDATAVLFTVQTRGGRCVGGTCGTTVIVDTDGRVHLAAKPPNELGFVDPDLLEVVDTAIQSTDFAELVSHPFTGECPTAYDGQEIVFEFATSAGVQQIASCQVEVDYDSPLFSAVTAAVGEFFPFPLP